MKSACGLTCMLSVQTILLHTDWCSWHVWLSVRQCTGQGIHGQRQCAQRHLQASHAHMQSAAQAWLKIQETWKIREVCNAWHRSCTWHVNMSTRALGSDGSKRERMCQTCSVPEGKLLSKALDACKEPVCTPIIYVGMSPRQAYDGMHVGMWVFTAYWHYGCK